VPRTVALLLILTVTAAAPAAARQTAPSPASPPTSYQAVGSPAAPPPAKPAVGSQVSPPIARHAPSSLAARGGPIDLNTVDPLAFRAIAARVPPGRAPRIDGRLDDEVWALAPASGQFIQREPHAGADASEPTEFRVLYDDRTIYFGVWAFDSDPSGIVATEMKRDSGLRKGDRVAIVIDTFHDRRNGFYFATNPRGAYKDAHYTDNGRVRNNDWNAVWQCETSIDERGWYVEMAIPLSQLRFRTSPAETTWGLNVARSIVRRNEETYWVPYPREQEANGFAYLSNAGVLEGLKGLRARRRLELVPFAVPQAGRDYERGASLGRADRYGADARIGLTDTLTADLTIRTDFAQVEADQEVVNISRFSLFFPEKRQFFTESQGLVDYGKPGVELGDFGPGLLPLFYSRRVGLYEGQEVPIIAGGRLTGRVGNYQLGVMNIETDETEVGTGAVSRVVPRANYSVVRVKRNTLAQSTIGAVFVNREGGLGPSFSDHGYNRAAGLDVNLALGRATRVTGLLARSFTPGVERGTWAWALDLFRQKDKYFFDLTYLDIGEGFNAEMGYIPRTDIRNGRVKGAWTPRPGWRGVRQVSIGGVTEQFVTHAGATESTSSAGWFGLTFTDTSTLEVTASRDYDVLSAPWRLGTGTVAMGGHRWHAVRARYATSPIRRVGGTATVETGGYYSGDKTTVSGALSLLPIEPLLVELIYNRNQIQLPLAPVYRTHTVSTRVSYSFSPTLFAKAFVQYNSDRRLASLNLLLWSIYRPGSDLYVVYNQGWNTNLPGPRALEVKNRSIAVKLTYWLSR
jgi:hypothetical protein